MTNENPDISPENLKMVKQSAWLTSLVTQVSILLGVATAVFFERAMKIDIVSARTYVYINGLTVIFFITGTFYYYNNWLIYASGRFDIGWALIPFLVGGSAIWAANMFDSEIKFSIANALFYWCGTISWIYTIYTFTKRRYSFNIDNMSDLFYIEMKKNLFCFIILAIINTEWIWTLHIDDNALKDTDIFLSIHAALRFLFSLSIYLYMVQTTEQRFLEPLSQMVKTAEQRCLKPLSQEVAEP